jgi:hypothetical protein
VETSKGETERKVVETSKENRKHSSGDIKGETDQRKNRKHISGDIKGETESTVVETVREKQKAQ